LDLVYIPSGTFTNKDIDLFTSWASDGQLYNTNSASDTTSVYSGTINVFGKISLASLYPGATAGQRAGVRVKHNTIGTTLNYIGLILAYT
jgi:hypothetical protein